MRLRLRIERNDLPPVSILWPISDSDQKVTIAQLLALVDKRVPLEAETWDLEDYTVTVGGYEALHYNEIGGVCKDEDEVVIRALQKHDRQLREQAGRDQISIDGRHLVDGVPFGRPLLDCIDRPRVSIPPSDRYWSGSAEVPSDRRLPMIAHKTNNDEHNLNQFGEVNHVMTTDEVTEGRTTLEYPLSPERRGFEANATIPVGSEATSSEEDDTKPTSDSESGSGSESESGSESGADSSSEQDSSLDSDSESEDSFSGLSENELAINAIVSANASGGKAQTGRKHDLNQGVNTYVKHQTTQNFSLNGAARKEDIGAAPPFQGTSRTRDRNHRRRDSRKLKYLKQRGILPEEATFTSLIEYEDSTKDQSTEGHVESKLELARQRLLDQLATEQGIDMSSVPRSYDRSPSVADDGGSPPEELSSTDPVMRATGADEAVSSTVRPLDRKPAALPTTALSLVPSSVQHPKRTSAATRMIFGSLGVKAPRTRDEANNVKAQLLKRSLHPSAKAKVGINADMNLHPDLEEDQDEDPEAWRQKLDLSAVECCDEGVTLSTPPFPFYQRWDPQYQSKRKQRNNSNYNMFNKRRKKNAANHVSYVETYDKYDQTNGDALNYDDDVDAMEEDEPYWDDGALLEYDDDDVIDQDAIAADQQLLAETTSASETHLASGDDFPPLPKDISVLPDLLETSALPGDFIVYSELACSAATNWQPTTVVRTVKLESRQGDEWIVEFAKRDSLNDKKEYDDEGQRVYKKFEMGGFSDDEDGDEDGEGVKMRWGEFGGVKLLKRGV